MSPTRVAKLQKKVQYCHTCCRKLQGDCTGADQVERRADILGRQGQVATPAAFYLGLCRLRGILSLPAPATVIMQAGRSSLATTTKQQAGSSTLRRRQSGRRAVILAGTMVLHRFLISSSNLRIDAAKKLNLGQTVHRFSISSLDLRIDASAWLIPGDSPIPRRQTRPRKPTAADTKKRVPTHR